MSFTSIKNLLQFNISGRTMWGTEAPVPDKEQWFINECGTKCCYFNGRLHCSSGPAYIKLDGSYRYYEDGLEHRTDGPAVVIKEGDKTHEKYYIYGMVCSYADFMREIDALTRSNAKKPLTGKIVTIDSVEYTLS